MVQFRLFLVIWIFVVVDLTYIKTNSIEVNNDRLRIVNGIPTKQGEFPYMVSIVSHNSTYYIPVCGGTIIDQKYVVTSAQCTSDLSISDILIIAGSNEIGLTKEAKLSNQKTLKAKRITAHPDFKSPLQNDIALVELEYEFTWENYIEPVMVRVQPLKSNAECVVLGWGSTQISDNKPSKMLYKAKVDFIAHATCKRNYKSILEVPDDTICGGQLSETTGPCLRDQGGPLICDNEFTGFVSYSNGCGIRKYPAIYTNVTKYLDWIDSESKRPGGGALQLSAISSVVTIVVTLIVIVLK